MHLLNAKEYLDRLIQAPRPGREKFLACFDARVDAICTDLSVLLIPLDDHICHRGDGLFESISYRQGRIFALDAHMQRMQNGAAALSLAPPIPWEEMRERILDVARAAGLQEGDLRVFLSRGPGGFGVSPSECPRAGLYIVALKAKERPESLYAKGVSAFTSRIPPKQDYLARIKNTNYLPNVFMAAEAEAKGKDIAVSFDEKGIMGEAAVANIALVDRTGRFLCPEFTNILPGTTLLAAMRLAAERMPVVQEPIRHEDIYSAREVLLLTSSTLCVSVTEFDERKVGEMSHQGRPGPVALWLKEALFADLYAKGTPF